MARTHLLGALTALLVATPSYGQSQDSTAKLPAVMDGRLRAEIALLSTIVRGVNVPAASEFKLGDQTIDSGSASGPVSVARGNLVVKGRITGDALVLHGDIIVMPGGIITGNAISVDGRIRPNGGVIEGDIRAIRGVTGNLLAAAAGRAGAERPPTTLASLKMALGWFAVLFMIGVGVLLFAEKNLDGVVLALEQDFSRSFWMGLLAQLGALPALLLVVVGLCLTIIGTLLVPFAIVAFIIGLAGLITLGFLAVSRFTGRAFFRDAAASRAVSLKSLFTGLAIYLGLWFLAAFFVWNPLVGSLLRTVALAGSWVALTFGLGAALITRAGTRRKSDGKAAKPADEFSWQTPTPVTGVVAARRPVATVKES
jgi:hypothetical protein